MREKRGQESFGCRCWCRWMVCAYASLNEVVTRVLSLFKTVAVAVIFHQKSKILITGIIFFFFCAAKFCAIPFISL